MYLKLLLEHILRHRQFVPGISSGLKPLLLLAAQSQLPPDAFEAANSYPHSMLCQLLLQSICPICLPSPPVRCPNFQLQLHFFLCSLGERPVQLGIEAAG